MAGQRFSLEDIIADEVKKQVGRSASSAPVDGLGSFGIKDIGDITKLLKEINAISQTMGGNRQGPSKVMKEVPLSEGSSVNKEHGTIPAPVPMLQDGSPCQERAPATSSLNIPRLVDNFIQYLPAVIAMYGDLRLSEVQPLLEKERDSIIAMLEGAVLQ